jgi:hypothetical protein
MKEERAWTAPSSLNPAPGLASPWILQVPLPRAVRRHFTPSEEVKMIPGSLNSKLRKSNNIFMIQIS